VQTDAAGYFNIKATPENIDTLNKTPSEVFVTVRDTQGNVVFRDEEALKLAQGERRFVDIAVEGKTVVGTPAPTPSRPEPVPEPERPVVGTVRGTVTDEKEKGVSGLTVTAFDGVDRRSKRLGSANTDRRGAFVIEYERGESGPTLFITVADAAGNVLFSSQRELREKAQVEENYTVVIPKTSTGSSRG